MFVPDRLKANAFRVLRLSADATLTDVHNAAGDLRRATLSDAITVTEADIPELESFGDRRNNPIVLSCRTG